TLLGGAVVAWPLAARGQQPALPVIGFLKRDFWSPDLELYFPATRRGMAEMGLVEGRDFTIEYRSAEGHTDRLLTLAADLVSRRVAVIVAPGNTPSALAAKQATQFSNWNRINTLTLGARLPTMQASRESIEAAGLISYGPSFPDLSRRAADYVDK